LRRIIVRETVVTDMTRTMVDLRGKPHPSRCRLGIPWALGVAQGQSFVAKSRSLSVYRVKDEPRRRKDREKDVR
jgi:hypothetical protein